MAAPNGELDLNHPRIQARIYKVLTDNDLRFLKEQYYIQKLVQFLAKVPHPPLYKSALTARLQHAIAYVRLCHREKPDPLFERFTDFNQITFLPHHLGVILEELTLVSVARASILTASIVKNFPSQQALLIDLLHCIFTLSANRQLRTGQPSLFHDD